MHGYRTGEVTEERKKFDFRKRTQNWLRQTPARRHHFQLVVEVVVETKIIVFLQFIRLLGVQRNFDSGHNFCIVCLITGKKESDEKLCPFPIQTKRERTRDEDPPPISKLIVDQIYDNLTMSTAIPYFRITGNLPEIYLAETWIEIHYSPRRKGARDGCTQFEIKIIPLMGFHLPYSTNQTNAPFFQLRKVNWMCPFSKNGGFVRVNIPKVLNSLESHVKVSQTTYICTFAQPRIMFPLNTNGASCALLYSWVKFRISASATPNNKFEKSTLNAA